MKNKPIKRHLSKKAILQSLADIISLERQTIAGIVRHLDDRYVQALTLMYNCPGKVIVTGVGKSGIIARKIAGTLSSTGTPSIFLHPTDALHGDLGAVQKRDVILALGKSGESTELNDILPVMKKIGVKIIAISATRRSALADHADVLLYTEIRKEACPLNLAPTNSTTAALVVGDALAITLMKMRDFKPEEYALFHPGGKLGKQLLLTVGDLMRTGSRNPVVRENDSVKNLLTIMTQKMAGAAAVVNRTGKLTGLVTDFDVRQIIESGENIFSKSIPEIMNAHPTAVTPEIKAIDALQLMEKRKKPISLLPVVDKRGRAAGLIHIHDILSKGLG